jgi:ribosomal protein S4
VTIKGKKVNAPSYLVKAEEENQIALTREFDFNTSTEEAESSG